MRARTEACGGLGPTRITTACLVGSSTRSWSACRRHVPDRPDTLGACTNTLEETAVSESATIGEFDHITSTAQLGSLLRRLRGNRTQQNIADHAKRHHLSVHRPDLSAIERGRRLPTSNELRGILYGCGRVDLFDRLDGIRQQLMAEPADPPISHDQHQAVIHLPAVEPGAAHVRARELDQRHGDPGRRRKLVIAVFAASALVIIAIVVLASRATDTATQPPVSEAPPSQLDTSYAPDGAAKTAYDTGHNHYQIYDTKADRRAVGVKFYRPGGALVGFQSCHEGAGDDCPGDLPRSVTGPLCMQTGVGLGPNPNDYTFGEQVCVPNA